MKPELIERTQNGSETYERYRLPCGTMLQKTTTPNPKSATPSARYRLRGRYATNKTVDQLLAQIEGLPDDPASRDESRHMSAHFVARALMHRAARNPGTMRELRNEANDALNKARAAGRAEGTARAAAPASAAQPVQEPEPEPRRQELAQIAMRWTDILTAYGFSACWLWNDGRAPKGAIAVVQCDRAAAGKKEKGSVEIHRGGFTRFRRGGLQVTHEEFTEWVQTPVPKAQPKPAPQQELPGMVRMQLQPDDAQAAAADLQALVDYACGSTGMTGQTLARAVRGGLELLGKLEEQLK